MLMVVKSCAQWPHTCPKKVFGASLAGLRVAHSFASAVRPEARLPPLLRLRDLPPAGLPPEPSGCCGLFLAVRCCRRSRAAWARSLLLLGAEVAFRRPKSSTPSSTAEASFEATHPCRSLKPPARPPSAKRGCFRSSYSALRCSSTSSFQLPSSRCALWFCTTGLPLEGPLATSFESACCKLLMASPNTRPFRLLVSGADCEHSPG